MYLCVTVKSRASCLISSSIKFLLYYLSKIQKTVFVYCVWEDTRAIACCEGQMTAYKSWFSSVVWAPGIQLRQQCIHPLSHLTDPLHLSFLMQGLSLNPKLTNFAILAGPRVPGICPSPPLQHRDTGPLSCAHLFIGLAGSN